MGKICRKCKLEKDRFFLKEDVCRKCGDAYPKRLIALIYSSEVNASKSRGMPPPNYTISELTSWILKQKEFKKLYKAWLKSKLEKGLKPSIDRIDENKPYSLSNIQLMTWAENKAKGELDCKQGKRYSRVKSICCFVLETGEFQQQYFSIHEAGRELNLKYNTISSAAYTSRRNNGNKLGRVDSTGCMFTLDYITNLIQDIEQKPRNLDLKEVKFSQINFDEDTCLVSII